jgi:hypothetical protein
MYLSAGKTRFKMHRKNDDIWFAENHEPNVLAPIEIDIPEPTNEKRAMQIAQVYSSLAYIEFMRSWREKHGLSETLERLREEEEEKQKKENYGIEK